MGWRGAAAGFALVASATGAAAGIAHCPEGQAAPQVARAPLLAAGARVLAIGSSSTSGVGASAPENAYPARLEALLAIRPGAVAVMNAGRGGERAAATLARLRALLAADPPDLVIWQTGVNDALDTRVDPAAFRGTLDAGIAAVRAAGAAVMLLDPQAFPGIPDPARYARFVAIVAEAGSAHHVAVIPRHAVMAAWDAATLAAMLSRDRFHMNDRGYACLAAIIAAALTAEGR
jgi:lysophospholipase L1-like esterase